MSFPWKINTLGEFSSGSIPVISLFKEIVILYIFADVNFKIDYELK